MSNISDEEIEKLATNFHVHFGYIYDQREKKIKPKEIVEWFIKNCINFSHQNKVSDPATEQSTSNWQKVGEKDKFMDEVRGNESAWKEKAELRLKIREKAKEMFDRYAIYKDNPIAWSIWKIAFNTALNPQFNEKEYASIKNKVSDVSAEDFLKEYAPKVCKLLRITSPVKYKQIISAMTEYASIVNERDNVVNDWISVEDRLPDYFKFGGFLVKFKTNMDIEMQCVASFENIPRHNFENSPMDKRWHVYPSSGHEIKPTHWKPIESQPK